MAKRKFPFLDMVKETNDSYRKRKAKLINKESWKYQIRSDFWYLQTWIICSCRKHLFWKLKTVSKRVTYHALVPKVSPNAHLAIIPFP